MDASFDFEDVFDEDYLYFYSDLLGEERSAHDAALVAGLVGLEPGMRVLDVPCGHGRIANRLAAGGAKVVAMDSNPLFLERARQDAAARGVDVDYLHADMRELPWLPGTGSDDDDRFDAVVNWFTSFGYFDDDTDRRLLQGFRRALRSGGRLVMDLFNRDLLLLTLGRGRPAPTFLVERGDDLMIDRVHLDSAATRTHTERILVRNGRVRRTNFSVRLFTLAELRGWLRDAGFGEVEAYAGNGTPFTWEAERLVVLARA
ncbi:MAG: class I SAM-dependent methyltransferase [Actinomycetota bacterium]|nr:class I SAM-dependent methyltransferase [Actinomycetota bacterium]